MSTGILAIGEAMVELAPAGAPDLCRIGIAGDTLNTAWYLRRLLPEGWQVEYFSRVGQGPFSQRMVDFLGAEGIGTRHLGRDAKREIGLYAISLKDGERSFSYWRETSAAKQLADDPAQLQAALSGQRLAYASGITFAILPEAGREVLLAALRAAQAQGTQVVFDTNLRPRLWADAGEMRHWTEKAASVADLVLPSFDDERDHFGDASPETTLSRYLALGARQVVVKAGGAPVHFGGAEGAGVVEGLSLAQPVDTTAAGDSFNAGYLAARLQGAGPEAAIRAGHALAAKVILHPGALVRAAVTV